MDPWGSRYWWANSDDKEITGCGKSTPWSLIKRKQSLHSNCAGGNLQSLDRWKERKKNRRKNREALAHSTHFLAATRPHMHRRAHACTAAIHTSAVRMRHMLGPGSRAGFTPTLREIFPWQQQRKRGREEEGGGSVGRGGFSRVSHPL